MRTGSAGLLHPCPADTVIPQERQSEPHSEDLEDQDWTLSLWSRLGFGFRPPGGQGGSYSVALPQQ